MASSRIVVLSVVCLFALTSAVSLRGMPNTDQQMMMPDQTKEFRPNMASNITVGGGQALNVTKEAAKMPAVESPPPRPVNEKNVKECSSFPKEVRTKCLKLLSELTVELTKIVAAGEGRVELISEGSSVDKAKALCHEQLENLSNKQVTMCKKLQTSFSTRMDSLIAADKDGGFCREHVSPKELPSCFALMEEILGGVSSIAALSDPPLDIPEGSPPEVGQQFCDYNSKLNQAQKKRCRELKESVMPKMMKVMHGDAIARGEIPEGMEAAEAAKKKPAASGASGATGPATPFPVVAPAAASGATGPAPVVPAPVVPAPKVVVVKEASAEGESSVPGPAATGKARAFCDEVPVENMEACKKYIIKLRYSIRAIAEKSGFAVEEMEKGKTVRKFGEAVCSKVTSQSETEECKNLKDEAQEKFAQLMGGPVGPEFSQSAQNKNAVKVVVVNATQPKKVEEPVERAATCVKIAKAGEKLGKECDALIMSGRKFVMGRMMELGKTEVAPSPEAKTVIAQGRSICEQLKDTACLDKVSEVRAKVVALQKEAEETIAKKNAILGKTGASGPAAAAADKTPEEKLAEAENDF